MHNPCIDLYPVEAEAAYHNPYSHPRIEQRRMRTNYYWAFSGAINLPGHASHQPASPY